MKIFFLSACALILTWQLLLPGFIGMASNGDFGKVAAPLCLDAADHSAYNFLYFQANYLRDANYCYPAQVPTSQLALAWIASSAEEHLADRSRFDIRWLGALHALIFLGFYFGVLLLLEPLPIIERFTLAAVALWIFADVGLIAYLNSFYSDVAAILGGLAAAVLAVHLLTGEKHRLAFLLLFGVASLLFITSKGQHGLFGFLPIALLLAIALRSRDTRQRITAAAMAVILLAGMIWVLTSTPDWYKAQARFNLIFFKIAKNSRTPARDLRELGLDDGDLRYVGMHSFMKGSPMNDPSWSRSFIARSTYTSVLAFYLHHPGRALNILWSDLRDETAQRRPYNLSNFQKEYGKPPGARTNRFASWSALRSWLFKAWPAHILVWFALVLLAAPRLAWREKSRFRRSLAWTAFTLALLAAAEFCLSSLADGCETYRHILMFHIFTDLTIFLALVFLASSTRNLFYLRS